MRLRRRLHIDTPRFNTEELQEQWQPKLWIRLIVLAILIAYVIAFVIENRKAVHLHFVLATASVSLVWLIVLSLGIGLIGGILLSQLERRRRRRRS